MVRSARLGLLHYIGYEVGQAVILPISSCATNRATVRYGTIDGVCKHEGDTTMQDLSYKLEILSMSSIYFVLAMAHDFFFPIECVLSDMAMISKGFGRS
jgi:hypothetical protein